MSQTSYSIDMTAAQDGQIFDIGFNDYLSGVAEVALVPGVFVTKGTSDNEVLLPDAVADVSNPKLVKGFVVRDLATEVGADGSITYAAKATVSVMRKGRIWVTCEDAFDQSDAVYVRTIASSPNLQLGRIRTDADTSNATLLSGVKILNSGAAGALALLQVDLL